jgi:hypothetical protein
MLALFMRPNSLLIILSVLSLTLLQGCTSTGTETANTKSAPPISGKCQTFEKFIPTPDGGNLVSGVDILRDSNGNITTNWKTTFPAGTQSTIDLLLWKSNKRDSLSLDGSSTDTTSCDGNVIKNMKPFTNADKGFNEGQYYAYLSFFDDNDNWKQPEGTTAALAAAKGKVKAVSKYGGSVMFELFARFDLPSCADLPTTTVPTPRPTMSKGETEAFARKIYAQTLQNKMSQAGHPVNIAVSGEDNTTLTIEDPNFTRETVMRQAATESYLAPFRKWHFKRLDFTDGVSTWGIDLR